MKRVIIDAALVFLTVGAVIGLFVYMSYSPVQFSPSEDLTETNVLFRFESADLGICRGEPQCASPQRLEVFDGGTVELDSGNYFIRVANGEYTEVRPLELNVPARFVFNELDDGSFQFVYAGTGELYVETSEGGEFILGGQDA